MYLFAGFLILGQVGSQLTTTGAFEVYLGDDLLFSKLETGRPPTVNVSPIQPWLKTASPRRKPVRLMQEIYDQLVNDYGFDPLD